MCPQGPLLSSTIRRKHSLPKCCRKSTMTNRIFSALSPTDRWITALLAAFTNSTRVSLELPPPTRKEAKGCSIVNVDETSVPVLLSPKRSKPPIQNSPSCSLFMSVRRAAMVSPRTGCPSNASPVAFQSASVPNSKLKFSGFPVLLIGCVPVATPSCTTSIPTILFGTAFALEPTISKVNRCMPAANFICPNFSIPVETTASLL